MAGKFIVFQGICAILAQRIVSETPSIRRGFAHVCLLRSAPTVAVS
jgi:hypothetical protein